MARFPDDPILSGHADTLRPFRDTVFAISFDRDSPNAQEVSVGDARARSLPDELRQGTA